MSIVPRHGLRWALAVAAVLAGFWFGLRHEPRRTGMAADRAAIYALALRAAPDAAPVPEAVRRVEAVPTIATYMTAGRQHREYGWLMREFPRLRQETVADFTRGQANRGSLRGVLPRGQFRVIRSRPMTDDESPRYSVSNIGFNAERTQAVVYVSHVCGGTCGSGSYLFLERAGSRWRISHSFMAWIS